jgi:glycosyltransferase involved in cell wall biosynthesis
MVHLSDFTVDSRVQREAFALAQRGDTVVSLGLSGPAQLPVGDGLVELRAVRVRKPNGGLPSYARGYGAFLGRALAGVAALARSRRVDLIEIHNMPNLLVATAVPCKLRGTPILLNVHDTVPELLASKFGIADGHPLMRLARGEERWSARVADSVVTVTDESRVRLAARGVARGRAHVVMNSPDEMLFGPLRPVVTPPAVGSMRIVYHGGLARRFGVECLIRALAIVSRSDPDVSLSIYGSQLDDGVTAELARRLAPGAVSVAPAPTPLEQIPDRLAATHVGVVPTLRDCFTQLLLPVKLLEYVHMGLPVVAARLPVIERYFGPEEISFFAPDSPESLARALAEIRREPEAAAERAARAQERLREHAWSRQRERYLALVDGLVRESGRVR